MFYIIESSDKKFVSTIKTKRYKTLKTASSWSTGLTVTKIMTFRAEDSTLWIENQLHSRLETLCVSERMSYLRLQLNQVLEAQLKIEQKQKTLYLTKRYITGYTLTDLLQHKKQSIRISNPASANKLIWDMLALFLPGQSFDNLIVTHQNLILQLSGIQGYKPSINYLSFVGLRFLSFNEEIDVSQYKQIAIYLDQQALNSGNINRFEFKIRNLACLILMLVIGKDFTDTLLKNVVFGNTVTLKRAKLLHSQTIQPKLQQLIKDKWIKERIDALQIAGLSKFISQALDTKQKKLNWSQVQSLLILNISSLLMNEKSRKIRSQKQTKLQTLNSSLCKISQQMWEHEDQTEKIRLISKGMQYVQDNPLVYLTLKMRVNPQTLLRDKKWDFMVDETYNRWKRELFYRLLEYHLNSDVQSEQMTQYLLNVCKSVLDYSDQVQRRQVHYISHEKKTLMAYQGLFQQ